METGVSFEPPIRQAKGLGVDYDWYKRHPDSLRQTIDILNSPGPHPKLMGLFSCFADVSIAAGVVKAAPSMGVVAAKGETALDALFSQSFAFLDSALAMRCQKDLEDAVYSLKVIDGYDVEKPAFLGTLAPPSGPPLPPETEAPNSRMLAPQPLISLPISPANPVESKPVHPDDVSH